MRVRRAWSAAGGPPLEEQGKDNAPRDGAHEAERDPEQGPPAAVGFASHEAETAEGEGEQLRHEDETEDDTGEAGRHRPRGERGLGEQARPARRCLGTIRVAHAFRVTMDVMLQPTRTSPPAPRTRTAARRVAVGAAVVVAALGTAVGLAACAGSDPTLQDLPSDIAQARPSISLEEASFVLDAQRRGATITGDSVDDDIETGTTTCWALKNGGVQVKDIAVDDAGQPLGNSGDALRTKQLIAAGITAFCPDYSSQISQLDLP